MKWEETNNHISRVVNKLLDKPRYFSVLYPALIIKEHGFERGVSYFRAVIGGEYGFLIEKLMNRDTESRDLDYWLNILDTYISNPTYRRLFLHLLRVNMEEKEIADFLRRIHVQPGKLARILGDLENIYELFEKLYYITVRDKWVLSILTGVPPGEIYLTDGLVKRAKWIADLITKRNSIVINGEPFTGKRTHLYLTALILLKKYGIPLIYPLGNLFPGIKAPRILNSINLQQILQSRDALFLATSTGIDPVILEEFLREKLLVASERDIGRELGVRGKIILLQVTEPELYSSEELREITHGLGLPGAESLRELHIRYVLEKTSLREEYTELDELLMRIVPRLYFTGRYRELLGLLIAAKNPCGIATTSMVDVIAKALGPEGRLGEVLVRLAPRVYGLPHPSWRSILESIIMEQDHRGIFKPYIELVGDIAEFKSSIAIKTNNSYEALAQLLCIDELTVPICRKGFTEALMIKPVHYFDESISVQLSGLKNKLVSIGIEEPDLLRIIEEYVKTGQYIERTGLEIDKTLSSINGVIVKPDALDPLDLFAKLKQSKNRVANRYFAIQTIPDKYTYKALYKILEEDRDSISEKLDPLSIGVITKNPGVFINYPQYSNNPVKCYTTGNVKCLERNRLIHLFYKAYLTYKLLDLKNARIMLYRAAVRLEEKASRMTTSILQLLLKTYELIFWTHYLEGEIREAGKILEEYVRAYDKYGELLPARVRGRTSVRLEFLKNIYEGRGSSRSDCWGVLTNTLIASRNKDAGMLSKLYESIVDPRLRIDPYNAKQCADTVILLINNGVGVDIELITKKYLLSSNPYMLFQLFRIINSYVKHIAKSRQGIPDKIVRLLEEKGRDISVYGNWASLLKAVIYRRIGILYLRQKPGKAREFLEKSIRELKGIREFTPWFISEQLVLTRLWREIAKIMNKDYSSCYEGLKNITKHYVKGPLAILSRYWYAKCLVNNGLYRQAYEAVSELFMIERRDPYKRLLFSILGYIVAARLGATVKKQFIELAISSLKKINVEKLDEILLRKISGFIMELLVNGDVSAAKELSSMLLLRIAGEKSLIEKLANNPIYLESLSEILVNMREVLDVSLIKQFIEVVRKLEIRSKSMILALLYIMMSTNMIDKAREFHKKYKKYLDKDVNRIIEAVMNYKQGNLKKAYKLVSKIKKPVGDPYLDQWLYYIRSLLYAEKGRNLEAYMSLKRIADSKHKYLDKEQYAEALYRLAMISLERGDSREAYSFLRQSLSLYEKLVFVFKKLNYLEKLSVLTKSLIELIERSTSYTLIQEAEKDLCSRIKRYRSSLLPRIYRQYFSEQHSYCLRLA